MRGLIALVIALAPASALAQEEAPEPLPAPWVGHESREEGARGAALACSDQSVFSRFSRGEVRRLDASGWTDLDGLPDSDASQSLLWVSWDGGSVFANLDEQIVRYESGTWTRLDAPLGQLRSRQMVSFDGEHVLAVGSRRVVAWDGEAYAAYDPGTWRDLFAISGSAEDDLWLGGQGGAVLHFDGRGSTSHPIETDGSVVQLWVRSSGDIWAVAEGPPGVFHWDGTAWSDRTPAGEHDRVIQVGGTAAEVYAVGNVGVLRWQPGGWVDVHRVAYRMYSTPRFRSVCATRTQLAVLELDGRVWVRPLDE